MQPSESLTPEALAAIRGRLANGYVLDMDGCRALLAELDRLTARVEELQTERNNAIAEAMIVTERAVQAEAADVKREALIAELAERLEAATKRGHLYQPSHVIESWAKCNRQDCELDRALLARVREGQ